MGLIGKCMLCNIRIPFKINCKKTWSGMVGVVSTRSAASSANARTPGPGPPASRTSTSAPGFQNSNLRIKMLENRPEDALGTLVKLVRC